ncbi:MAG: hypothetical protein ACQEVA_18775 [Myxococcota bacterium]
MNPQRFELRSSSIVAAATVLFVIFSWSPVFAQDASLQDAVESLREGRYEQGLETLSTLDASSDPRVDYYRGFALEKIGQCEAAKSAYRQAESAASNPRVEQVATEALEGFDGRCVPTVAGAPEVEPVAESQTSAPASASGQLARGSGRVGWKVFGWTTAILGGITLAAVPVKSAIEDRAFQRTAPYFELRYGCDVSSGDIVEGSCEKTPTSDDPVYDAYQQGRDAADTAGRYMVIGGTTLAGLGVATLVTVALTRPSAPVQWSLAPTQGGAQVGAILRF